ncbi:VCBS domain-containing protein, partial [Roseibium sp. FZY0029]|uniref:VCBS domain-containing protein n=1 Tax=Roseibium sp. FZY0029 TaxID=3116647 RepID=UPI002EA99353|nr:VCBS domain-containing protein [Roseibium sp. FZY0029]
HPVDGFTMNQDGSWSFDPSHAAYQHLAAGQTQQVTIPVTVTDSAGATDTQNLVITVTGTNDTPVVTGTKTGTVTEDQVSSSGQLQTNWQNIDVLDPDGAGESHIMAIEIGGVLHQMPADLATTLQSSYGYFHTTHGTDGHDKWMYFADNSNPAIQGLKTGETLQETAFLVTADGTKVPLDVTIKGHEDSVVIDTPGALVSPIGTAVEDGKTQISGTLQAHDADTHDTVSFAPQTTTNAYGVFSVDAAGHWTFTLDNQAAQSLANGQQHAMGFDIKAVSSDGSTATQHVEVNVRGTNDTPTLKAASASATEDGKSVTGQMSATDVDAGDTKSFSISQPVDGFTLNQDGSWSFDPSHAAYQHLAAGQTQQITIPVTVTDSAGATDTENLVITVTGSNDGPVVSGPIDLGSGTEDKVVQISAAQLLAHTTDIDTGDTLSVTGLSASHGTITGDAAHGFTFTPDPNYNGPVSLSYQVTDGHGGSVAQTASLTLGATPDAAIISGTDTGDITEDRNVGRSSVHPLGVSGILTVHDPDGTAFDHFQSNSLGEHAVSDPFGGSLHIDRAGNWGYEVD